MLTYKCDIVCVIQFLSAISLFKAVVGYDYYYDQKPLFLTPYLKAGNITQAQQLAQTNVGGRISYSGYFTTDEDCGNHLFQWFFPADNDSDSAPMILWLNGGPGSTSMYGLFTEIGPWNHLKSSGFVENKFAWTKDHNVLFTDQPVGTGFSFTEKDCYPTNITEVTRNMYTALVQFFQMFPNLQKKRFFIAGESFASHYNLELAVKIHKENQVGDQFENQFGRNPCWERNFGSGLQRRIGSVVRAGHH
ncbi:venom serine carboxypeptidase-like [Homalodisca vitripennis]|uniref:venom serine carboxypeptidase-like n=1 Tax=Homalodisca vitripennis TaxID=197043 RepID=UPI001EEB6B97|nr:venom serine carboxypeptidase-like [Homalodisca vitripennis]